MNGGQRDYGWPKCYASMRMYRLHAVCMNGDEIFLREYTSDDLYHASLTLMARLDDRYGMLAVAKHTIEVCE